MEFIESFMKFAFADDDVFRIEKDELVCGCSGLKACECVVLISPRIAFIEAKSSTPNPNSGERFNEFIDDIKQKFTDSLNLFEGIKTGHLGEEALMRLLLNLRNAEIHTNDYLIYLIVHGHRLDWLSGLQDALRSSARCYKRMESSGFKCQGTERRNSKRIASYHRLCSERHCRQSAILTKRIVYFNEREPRNATVAEHTKVLFGHPRRV